MENHGPTALKICHFTVHQKVGEENILKKSSKFNSFAVKGDLLNGNPQSSYYSGSYGDRAVKISHDTVHQIVSEQHI